MTTGTKKSQVNAFVKGKTEILKTFSVKGYKSWTAREGVGAQTNLYKDGKKVGLCTDEGNGGEVVFWGDTVEAEKMVWEFVKSLPKYEWNDYFKERFGEDEFSHYSPFLDLERKKELQSWKVSTFADIMLEQAEEEKQLKKLCKTKLVVRVEGEQNLKAFNAKWPKDTYGQMMLMSQLTKQLQPQVITEFVNKRFN